MKRMRLLTMMFAAMVASGAMAQDEYNTWPWDFPQNIKLEVELGQTVLSPEGHYFAAIEKKEDLSKATLIWYDKKVDKVGEGTTTINKFGQSREVPNALIIPLKKQQKAQKGDILLTWWQGGSGLQRAIVIDDSTPTEPTAVFIDLYWPDDPNDPKVAERAKGRKLEPNSFNVLKDGEWESGAQVAYRDNGEWKSGIIMNTDGDKLLLSGWADKLVVVEKGVCKLIPFKEKIKKGDKVWCEWLDYYKPGYTVEKIDQKLGHVWVKRGDSNRIECKGIHQITKTLD